MLIRSGFFRYTRNPNYLGEMLLYSGFAIMLNHWYPWIYLASVWCTVFTLRMLTKDCSLRKKLGWDAYAWNTNILLPKIGTHPLTDWYTYIIVGSICVYIYVTGGITETYITMKEMVKFWSKLPFFQAMGASERRGF